MRSASPPPALPLTRHARQTQTPDEAAKLVAPWCSGEGQGGPVECAIRAVAAHPARPILAVARVKQPLRPAPLSTLRLTSPRSWMMASSCTTSRFVEGWSLQASPRSSGASRRWPGAPSGIRWRSAPGIRCCFGTALLGRRAARGAAQSAAARMCPGRSRVRRRAVTHRSWGTSRRRSPNNAGGTMSARDVRW